MPYKLLAELEHAQLPLRIHGTAEIDKVLMLDAAKLALGHTAQQERGRHTGYAEPAKVLCITPRGRSVLWKRRH